MSPTCLYMVIAIMQVDEVVCCMKQNVTMVQDREGQSSRKGEKKERKRKGREEGREREREHECVIQNAPECEWERNEDWIVRVRS